MRKFTLLLLTIFTISFGYSQNLALNGTTASSSGISALAVDGDGGTRWESDFNDAEWWSVDLGATYDVGQVIITWEGAYADQYTIEISSDNTNWTTIYTEAAGDGATDDLVVSGNGRYIRYNGTHRALPYGHSFYEFEVYGAANPLTDTTLSDLTVNGNTISGFSANTLTYDIALDYGTTTVPTVVGSASQSAPATAVTTDAESLPGTSTVLVTAQNGVTTATYILNFTVSGPTTPLTAAPVPTNASIDVISVYSDSYSNIYTDINPGWGQATTTTEIQVESNNTLKYENLNYQGLVYSNSDVSAMEYLHLDYYTVDATAFQFFLIAGGENAYDIAATEGITQGSWVSIDIPLTYFSEAGRNLADAFQFKTVGEGTLFLDNIYFWKNPAAAGTDTSLSDLTVDGNTIDNFGALTTNYSVELPAGTTVVPTLVATPTDNSANAVNTDAVSIPGTTTILVTAADGTTNSTISISFTLNPDPLTAAPTPTKASGDVISVYSDAYTNIYTSLNPGWGQSTAMTEIQVESNNTLKYAGLNYQGTEYATTDISEMKYVHLDYYTSDATAFQFFLIAGGENAYDIAATDGITLGSWVSLDIPMTFFSDAGRDLVNAIQFKVVGDGTLYLDNLYFWKEPNLGINDIEIDGLKAYPNPTNDMWTISTNDQVIVSIELFDISGRKVTSLQPNALSAKVDASNLSSGVYFSVITTEEGSVSQKLIKK